MSNLLQSFQRLRRPKGRYVILGAWVRKHNLSLCICMTKGLLQNTVLQQPREKRVMPLWVPMGGRTG